MGVVEFVTGGFINLGVSPKFADFNVKLPSVFEAMFEVPEVNAMFDSFMTKIYRGLPYPSAIVGDNFVTAPDGYCMAVVNLCGRAITVIIPRTIWDSNAYGVRTEYMIGPPALNHTCTCSTDKSPDIPEPGCDPGNKQMEGWTSRYCSVGCSGTCTLDTGKILATGGFDVMYSAEGYQF